MVKEIPLNRRTEGEREAYRQGYNAGFKFAVERLTRATVESGAELTKTLLQSSPETDKCTHTFTWNGCCQYCGVPKWAAEKVRESMLQSGRKTETKASDSEIYEESSLYSW